MTLQCPRTSCYINLKNPDWESIRIFGSSSPTGYDIREIVCEGHWTFLRKIKSLGRIPEDAFLVTADVLGLYPSIPHYAALHEKLEERSDKKIPSADLVDKAEFVLKNNFFEFDSKVKQHISGTAIGTICMYLQG